jgi:2-polyprenyl-3-methyl-5-hydroxy-6-metoxy-1,4-benzoquinol methylase
MTSLKELNTQSWDDRLEARAHTYQVRSRFRFALGRLVAHQPKHWLDVGTGNGYLPKIARPKLNGVRITGTDFAHNAIQSASSLDEGIVNDIDESGLPFADRSFDFISCLEVIEHLIFPEKALSEMHRVLKPGGHLVVTVPNIQFIEYVVALIRGKMPGPAADTRHMSVYTHRFLRQQMQQAGLTVTERAGCDASPEWFSKISRRFLCKTIAVEAKKG